MAVKKLNPKKIQIKDKIRQSGIVKDVKQISLLGRGGFSDCYLLKTNKSSFVLKVRRDNKVERLEREFKLLSQKKVVKKNLAPNIIKFDKSCRDLKYPYLLEEFIVGINPKKTKVDSWFIKSMAKFYKDLHSITSKSLEHIEVKKINSLSFWAKDALKEHKKLSIPSKDIDKECKLFFKNLIHISKNEDSIFKRDIYNFVHCDSSKDNIFIMKDKKIKLIDWDFAGFHIFERDLALFIDIYNLNKKQELLFLKSYGINPNIKFMKKLNILKLILFAGDINWLLSQENKDIRKIKRILKKSFKIIKELKLVKNK